MFVIKRIVFFDIPIRNLPFIHNYKEFSFNLVPLAFLYLFTVNICSFSVQFSISWSLDKALYSFLQLFFSAEVALILSNGGKVLQNPKTEGWSNYLFFLLDLTLWQVRRNIKNVSWDKPMNWLAFRAAGTYRNLRIEPSFSMLAKKM